MMSLKCFAYHFFFYFIQRQGLFHIFFRVLNIVIIFADSRLLYRMNNGRHRRLRRHYRSGNYRTDRAYLSGTFSHQIVHHLFQFRHFLPHIEQNGIKNLPLAFKTLALTCTQQCGKTLCILRGKISLQDGSVNLPVSFNNRNLLGDILQLAHISRPRIGQQFFLCVFRQLNGRHSVFLCKVGSELTEQQEYIVSAFTKRRYLDRHSIQPIVQVFTETSLRNGLRKIDVGSRHNTHIRLLYA